MPLALGRDAGCLPRGTPRRARRALTLVELLVVVAILGVLMALLLPAISGTRAAARSFKCQSTLRSIAFDFTVFGDEQLHGWRGDDETLGNRFRLETFQESQYRVDEFWGWGDERLHVVPDPEGNNIMRCSEAPGSITLLRDVTCSDGAVTPPQNISFGFNIRLHAVERRLSSPIMNRVSITRGVPLTMSVLEPSVPLVWDVDGAAAAAKGANPIFSGPSLSSIAFSRNAYWYPAARHAGRINAAFVDGSVRDSKDPLAEHDWEWGFSPVP